MRLVPKAEWEFFTEFYKALHLEKETRAGRRNLAVSGLLFFSAITISTISFFELFADTVIALKNHHPLGVVPGWLLAGIWVSAVATAILCLAFLLWWDYKRSKLDD